MGQNSRPRVFARSNVPVSRRLVVPTAKPPADFRRQVTAHAGHTQKRRTDLK
ncbi:MAG: hypothetical protein GX958_03475 [Desulfitobacterium sp.]|nr:hypothetical protein [Desulfitobacterium sp.]